MESLDPTLAAFIASSPSTGAVLASPEGSLGSSRACLHPLWWEHEQLQQPCPAHLAHESAAPPTPAESAWRMPSSCPSNCWKGASGATQRAINTLGGKHQFWGTGDERSRQAKLSGFFLLMNGWALYCVLYDLQGTSHRTEGAAGSLSEALSNSVLQHFTFASLLSCFASTSPHSGCPGTVPGLKLLRFASGSVFRRTRPRTRHWIHFLRLARSSQGQFSRELSLGNAGLKSSFFGGRKTSPATVYSYCALPTRPSIHPLWILLFRKKRRMKPQLFW